MDTIESSSGRSIRRGEFPPSKTPLLSPTNVVDFFKEVKLFSDEHLSGLIKFSYDGTPPFFSYFLADVAYVARFFKELLFCVRAKEIIYVTFKNDSEHFGAEIIFDGIQKLSKDEISRIESLASSSGFDFKLSDSIVIKAKIARMKFALVYAVGTVRTSKIFENVMFDIQNNS